MIYRTAWLIDTHQPHIKEAAICKLYGSEVASRCVHKAVQIHGALGYSRDYWVERAYRDARIAEIFEGTTRSSASSWPATSSGLNGMRIPS